MLEYVWELPDEAATVAVGSRWAAALTSGMVIYLYGELGAGKTSFTRALLRALNVGERIKSPTYSLLEAYRAGERAAWHLDLYRIADPEELQWLGLDALADPAALVLIEWPERGAGALPAADVSLQLAYEGKGRRLRAQAHSERAKSFLSRLG